MNKKTDSMNVKDTLRHYLYSLKLMIRLFPISFFFDLLFNILQRVMVFFSFTYLLRYVVNGIQNQIPVANIMAYVFAMMAANVVFVIINATYGHLIKPIIDRKSDARLKKAIFRRSLELDYANFDNPEAYEKYNRVLANSSEALDCAKNSVLEITKFFLSITLNSWLIFTIDPMLFVFAFLSLITVVFTPNLNREYYGYSIEERKISRKNAYVLRSFYQAEFAKEMRLTNLHKLMIARFETSSDEFIHLLKTKRLKLAMLSFLDSFVTSCMVPGAAQLYAIYRTVVSKAMLFGDCLVVLNSISVFSGVASSIKVIISHICDSALYIHDYRSFMSESPEVNPNLDGLEPTDGEIEFKNVSFRYQGAERDVLHGVSLKIKKGEKIAIVGKNGAGKTTLVKLLLRLYDPQEGEIFVGGHDIREYKLKEYRCSYGVVFQDYKQISTTVAENVLGRTCTNEDTSIVIDSLKKAGIWDTIANHPQGIHAVMTREFDDNGLILSGGQAQKIAIAAIYARNFSTVILDEPSSALDPLAEHEMYKNMMDACVGKTVIVISHRLSSAVSADRVFFVENGRVCEQGSHAELMCLDGEYAKMYRMQAQNYTDDLDEGSEHEQM